MKRFIPLLVAILVFGLLLFLDWLPSNNVYRLSFPGVKGNYADINYFFSNNGQFCTAKGTLEIGFPFKENLYDYCTQQEQPIIRVVRINLIIDFIITTAAFVLAKKLVVAQKPHKKL